MIEMTALDVLSKCKKTQTDSRTALACPAGLCQQIYLTKLLSIFDETHVFGTLHEGVSHNVLQFLKTYLTTHNVRVMT